MLYETAKAGIDLRVMAEEELKAAIQKPLQVVHPDAGKRFQTALLNRLAQDAAEDAAYLPLLQVTLEDLWRGGLLTVDHYQSLTDAIRNRADEIYAFKQRPDGGVTPRSPDERQRMLDIFLDLVDVSFEDDIRRDVRRARRTADVAKGDAEVEALIHELAASRLLVTDEKELDGGGQEAETVDIIHESLIHNWERLSSVIQTERERLQQRRRFELRLDEWLDREQATNRLLSGVQLEEVIQLQDLEDVAVQSDDAKEFIAQSTRARERRRSRNQRVAIGVVGVLLVSLIIAGLAFREQLIARRGEQEALEQAQAEKNRAEQEAIASLASTLNDSELRLRLPLASIQNANRYEEGVLPATVRELLSGLSVAPLQSARGATDFASNVAGLAFDPDGRLIAMQKGTNIGTGLLYDLQSDNLTSWPDEVRPVNYVHFIPGSRRMIVDAWPEIHVVNKRDLGIHCTISDEPIGLYYQDLNPEDGLVMTADEIGLRLWSMEECAEIAQLPFPAAPDGFQLRALASPTDSERAFFNADRTQLVVQLRDVIYRWDITQPDSPVALDPIEGATMASSPDRSLLLLSSEDEVFLLDTTSGEITATGLDRRQRGPLSPDGRLLWTAERRSPSMTLWDVESGESIRTIPLARRLESWGWYDQREPAVLLVRDKKQVVLYAAETGDLLFVLPAERGESEIAFAMLDPSGNWLVVEVRNRLAQDFIEIWDIKANAKVAEYGFISGFFKPIEFSPDGRLMAVLGNDPSVRTSTLRVWEFPSLDRTRDLFASPATVMALTEQHGLGDSLFDAEIMRPFGHMSSLSNPVIVTTPNERAGWILDYSCADIEPTTECEIDLWDLNQGRPIHQVTLPCNDLKTECPLHQFAENIIISQDGRWLVAVNYYDSLDEEGADPEGTVAVWDLQAKRRLPFFQHETWVEALTMSPTAPQMATMDGDGIVRLWDLEGSVPTPTTIPLEYSGLFPHPTLLEFSPDGKRLLHTTWEESGIGSLLIWDSESLEPLESYHLDLAQARPGVRDFRMAPDGASVFVVLEGDIGSSVVDPTLLPGLQIQRWQIDGLAPIGEPMIINNGVISDMAFLQRSVDGGLLLATAGSDGLARIWHADSGDLLLEVPHQIAVDQVVFAPDGRGLFTLDSEERLHAWPIDFTDPDDDTFGLVEEACRRLSRDFTEGEWAQYFGDRQQEPLCLKFASSGME